MDFILSVACNSIGQVWLAWLHNWPYLGASIVIAALLKLLVDAEKVSAFLSRYRGAGVVAVTTAAVATPLCSCGTTAVVLGMMASMIPWAPIVAFMVASPLTSPEELIYSAGLFGWPFALAFFFSSIVLGLAGGWLAGVFESRGWLANQLRFTERPPASCGCSSEAGQSAAPSRVFSFQVPRIETGDRDSICGCAAESPAKPATGCGCGAESRSSQVAERGTGCGCSTPVSAVTTNRAASTKPSLTIAGLVREFYDSAKHLAVMFTGFAFIGYFLNGLIPVDWVGAVFGSGNTYSVPLAATLGLPLYINSEASLPLIRTLMDAGMSQGAALAFTISGSGTSIGAIAGALTIARWRVVALVVGVLWLGAILSGLAFNLALALI